MANAFANREEITAHQLQKLRALFAAIIPANSFYAKKLSGMDLELSTVAEFSEKVPFTTKLELVADQEKTPPYGTNLTFPLERYTRLHQTSGTTGAPLRWLDTPESWAWMVESWENIFRAADVGASDKVYFGFSFGPFIGFWLAFDAGQKIGALCVPGGGLSSEARLKSIFEIGITVLCCTPTYALRLAEVAARDRIDLAKSCVKKLIVAGEPGGSIPATRARLEKSWPGAKVFDHHGMTEVGPVTYECPVQPGILHVMESAYLAEIIAPQNERNVSAGEMGELILTPLGRIGSPLLRYRTGDLVRRGPDATCACGRNDLTLPGGILGRTDDMIIVRGVNIHPSAIENVLRSFEEIAEYQAMVKTESSLCELSLRVEPKSSCEDVATLASRLEKQLQATFSLRIPVATVPAGTLPRFEMKAKRWIRDSR